MSMTLVLLAAATGAQPQIGRKAIADCSPMALRVAARVEANARQARPDRKPVSKARPCMILASA